MILYRKIFFKINKLLLTKYVGMRLSSVKNTDYLNKKQKQTCFHVILIVI